MELRNKNGLTEEEFLKAYKPGDYEKPSNTVDMLLFTIDEIASNIRKNSEKELKVLLIKRGDHPFINQWAIPGGFVNITEDIEDAAYRELEEETHLKDDVYLEQLGTFGKPKRDPRMRVISIAYMALTKRDNIKKTLSGDDASDALWFNVSKENLDSNNFIITLKNNDNKISIGYRFNKIGKDKNGKNIYNIESITTEKLAFDHIEILNTAIDRLRGKIFYTNIAFNLLSEQFTLSELRQVYEVILGKTLDNGNFRKKISDLVEEVPKTVEEKVGHRPSKYYRLKEED